MANLQGLFFSAILIIFLSNGTEGSLVSSILQGNEKELRVLLAKRISSEFVERLTDELQRQSWSSSVVNPEATLLPPADDPATIQPISIPLNISIPDPKILITGVLNLTEEARVTGLSKLTDELNVKPTIGNISVTWDFGLPAVTIVGQQVVDLILDLGSKHSVMAHGLLFGNVQSVFLKLGATIKAPVNIALPTGLSVLDLDLGFSNLRIDLGDDSTIDGEAVIDWERQSQYLQIFFDSFWTDEARPLVNEMVRCSIDHVINDCTLIQLSQPQPACLKMELNPVCFGEEETTTTVGVSSSSTVKPGVSTTVDPGVSTTVGGGGSGSTHKGTFPSIPDSTTEDQSGTGFLTTPSLILPLVSIIFATLL